VAESETLLAEMLIALRESMSVPTKLEAGQLLAYGGWAVFPVPDQAKFDNRLSYLNATTDPGIFREMADDVMSRHECRDVNVCLCPGKSAVPLLVIDLDGADAITRFRDEAWERGHADLGLWLRVNTTRPDEGRHAYFSVPSGGAFGNGKHRWGGEVRSAKGHVVMPPSSTALGRYTWSGEALKEAPDWLVEGLPSAGGGGYRRVPREELGEWLESLSQAEWTSYARAAFEGLLAELREARSRGNGRNPTLAKVLNRVLDLALDGELSALEALADVQATYLTLFDEEEKASRNLGGEFIRCVESWTRNKEGLEDRLASLDGLQAWVRSRTGDEKKETRAAATVLSAHIKQERPAFRSAINDWKARIGK
jgi:hypothetical protein